MNRYTASILHYFKDRWILWLGVIAFIIYKLPYLHYPFYWDESWSYEPAIRLMYQHGPSMMPNAIDTHYSRGHPLLFYFLSAAWMRLFGPSAYSQHVFALLVSVLVIVLVYEVCLQLFNKRVAILSLAILPLQCMFFVQSTMLLPEIMVALFSLLSLYLYVQHRYVLTFLSLLALMLTKESGMVMGLVLGIHATLNLFNKNRSVKDRVLSFCPVLLAGIGIGLFFVLQKYLNGWFMFPEHLGYITFDRIAFIGKLNGCLDILFYEDNLYLLYGVVVFFALMTAINTKNIRNAIPVMIGIVVYISLADKLLWLPRTVKPTLFLLLVLAGVYQLAASVSRVKDQRSQFVILSGYFIVGYIVFSSFNFLTARYTMAAFVFTLILAVVYLDHFIAQLYELIYILTVVVVVFIGQQGINTDTGYGDMDMGAFDGMAVQQDIVTYMEQKSLYDKVISAVSFQEQVHLADPNTGFLQGERKFTHVHFERTDSTEYAVFDNIEPDNGHDIFKSKHPDKLVFRTEHNGMWGEIYRLK